MSNDFDGISEKLDGALRKTGSFIKGMLWAAFVVFMALLVITVSTIAYATASPNYSVEPGEPSYLVRSSVFCNWPSVEALAKALQKTMSIEPVNAAIASGGCKNLGGMTVPVKTVFSGPKTDADGDTFYIVRVGKGIFTFAWPGFNTNIPEKISFEYAI